MLLLQDIPDDGLIKFLNDASHDDTVVDIFDDSDGVDTVACPVTLSSSLDSLSADAINHMFYAVDVCNLLSS